MDRTGHWNAAVTTGAGIALGILACASAAAAGDGHIQASDWLQFSGTILAALMALGAATFAAIPIYRQLKLLRQQTAANAITAILWAAQALDEEFFALECEANIYGDLKFIISRAFKSQPDTWSDDFKKQESLIFVAKTRSMAYNERNPEGGEFFDARFNFHISCLALLKSIYNLYICGSQKDYATRDELIFKIKTEDELEAWEKARVALLEVVRKERRAYWAKVRALERAALGLPTT